MITKIMDTVHTRSRLVGTVKSLVLYRKHPINSLAQVYSGLVSTGCLVTAQRIGVTGRFTLIHILAGVRRVTQESIPAPTQVASC